MNIAPTAIPYAKALFDLAKERNELETIISDMKLIASACSGKDFMMMLKSPVINPDKKLKIVREVFKGNISKTTFTFLDIIIRKRREKFIPDIAEAFEDFYQDYKGILVTRLRTAIPVTSEIREEIISIMKKHTDKEIVLEEETDEALIGGFILNWKDKQYDASIRSQINRLRKGIASINLFVKKL